MLYEAMIGIPLCFAFALWISISLPFTTAHNGPRIRISDIMPAIMTGYGVVFLAFSISEYPTDPTFRLTTMMFGALTMAAVTIDFRTAWAPDVVMAPWTFLLVMTAAGINDWHLTLSAAVAWCVAGYLAAQGLWQVQDRIKRRRLPPADLIAISAPFALFGVSTTSSIIYLSISVIILALLKVPEPIFRRLCGPAALCAAQQAGLTNGSGRAMPLLPVIFPVILVFLIGTILLTLPPTICRLFA